MTALQDLLVQTYSGKVVAFSEEEVGTYQPTAPASSSPLKKLSSQLSKVCPPVILSAHHNLQHMQFQQMNMSGQCIVHLWSCQVVAVLAKQLSDVPFLCQSSITHVQ